MMEEAQIFADFEDSKILFLVGPIDNTYFL